jgi:hypothetical protein
MPAILCDLGPHDELRNRAGVPAGLVCEPRDKVASHIPAGRSVGTVNDDRPGELVVQDVVPRVADAPCSIR